jgi:hypothetical protein
MRRPASLLFAGILASLSHAGESDLRARLEDEYALLGDEEPAVREAATERMRKEGLAAAAFVREKLSAEKDAEVVGRLLQVLRAIELEELVELEGKAEEAMAEVKALESRFADPRDEMSRLESDLEAARMRLEKVVEEIRDRVDRQEAAAPPEEPEPEPEGYLRSVPNIGDLAVEPKIDGEVLFLGRRDSHIVISAGSDQKVEKGMKFTVYRGERYVSKLVVTSARRGFAICREILDFRKEPPRQGDSVSTRVFD